MSRTSAPVTEPTTGTFRTGARERSVGFAGVPRWLYLPALVALALIGLPLAGMVWAVDPRMLWAQLSSPAAAQALGLSLRTCLVSTSIAMVLGLPLAVLLGRGSHWWQSGLRLLALLPMVLPPVVAGIALQLTLGRRGLLGPALGRLGIEIGFTTTAVVIAQVFVCLPYFVLAVDGALRSVDPRLEVVAATLGASPSTVLRRVTLPAIAPAVVTGASMAFARALGEFGATLTFAGSLQGTTRTMPLQIYLERELDPEAAVSLSVLLVLLAVLVLGAAALLARWLVRRTGGPRSGEVR